MDITKEEDIAIKDEFDAGSKVITQKKVDTKIEPAPTIKTEERTGNFEIDSRMTEMLFLQHSMEGLMDKISKNKDGVKYEDYKTLNNEHLRLQREIAEIKESNISSELKDNEITNTLQRYQESIIREDQLKEQLAGQKNAKESAEVLLSGNKIGSSTTVSALTQDSMNISAAETIAQGSEGKTQSLDHNLIVKHEQNITNIDRNTPDSTLLSSRNFDGTVAMDMPSTQTSAQAAYALIRQGEITIGSSADKLSVNNEEIKRLENEERQLFHNVTLSPEAKERAIMAKKTERVELMKRNLQMRREIRSLKKENDDQQSNIDRIKIEDDAKKEKEIIAKQELEDSGGHIGAMADIVSGDTEDDMEIDLEEQFSRVDIMIKAHEIDLNSVKENLQASTVKVEDIASDGTDGEARSDTFSPSDDRKALSSAQQHDSLKLSPEQTVEVKKELSIYYSSYQLARVNNGVAEAQTLGTNLFTSDNSTRKLAGKVRGDISTLEEDFGGFMKYLLHDVKDLGDSKWTLFLEASAALGFNNLTEAQMNYLITLNVNGDLGEDVNFMDITIEDESRVEIREGLFLNQRTIDSLNRQIASANQAQGRYPSQEQAPTSPPQDNSTFPNGSTGEQRRNASIPGSTTSVLNIPDPRTSERGGENISNTRQVTIKNRNYDPKLKPGDPKYEPPFVQMDVPDVAAGSKDIQAEVEASEADRLLNSQPQSLYPSIHPQACDRYLGSRNYKRLGVPSDEYMAKYSEHGWEVDDYEEMYAWNLFTMKSYGNMLYAFVTDIRMQRTTPVFDPNVQKGILLEFKELNELIKELTRYQQKADDRADRIAGGGIGARPLEKALDQFFDKKNSGGLSGPPPNSIVIAGNTPGKDTPGKDDPGKDDPGKDDPGGDTKHNVLPDPKDLNGYVEPKISNKYIDDHTMNFGITNSIRPPTLPSSLILASTTRNKRSRDLNSSAVDYNKRQRMFHSFSGR